MFDFILPLLCFNLTIKVNNQEKLPGSFEQIYKKSGNKYQPEFVLAKQNMDLYIIIRDVVDITDFLIILDYVPFDFHGSKVHHGVFLAAKWVIEQCKNDIANCNGKIFVTGYSLGASVASMIATILRYEENYNNVFAFGFGGIPILGKSIAKNTRSFITNFVVNQDLFPAFNPKNFDNIIQSIVPKGSSEAVQGAMIINDAIKELALSLEEQNHGKVSDEMKNAINAESMHISTILLNNVGNADNFEDLVNPGIVYHLLLIDKNYVDIKKFDENIQINSVFEIISVLKDHMINVYKEVLYSSKNEKYPDYL